MKKRVVAFLVAAIMVLGVSPKVYAETVTKGIPYSILVNGDKKAFTEAEAIVVDSSAMFTADCYLTSFACKGVTQENIAKAKAFDYEGAQYYSLREVADACGMKVFWDSETKTALVVDVEKYERIKALIEASSTNNAEFKKVEMEMNGDIGISVEMMGTAQSLDFPFEGAAKIDIEAPFMEFTFKLKSPDMPADMKMYDDGKATYINSGEETWFKTESSLAQSKDMLSKFGSINSAVSTSAMDLSIAGLRLAETPSDIIVEGDMYLSETFKSANIEAIVKQMYDQMGVDMSLKYEWPKTVYVKYVMDKEGNIKRMSMTFAFGMSMDMDGQPMVFNVDAKLDFPKYVIDGDFETVVPQQVLDKVVE